MLFTVTLMRISGKFIGVSLPFGNSAIRVAV